MKAWITGITRSVSCGTLMRSRPRGTPLAFDNSASAGRDLVEDAVTAREEHFALGS